MTTGSSIDQTIDRISRLREVLRRSYPRVPRRAIERLVGEIGLPGVPAGLMMPTWSGSGAMRTLARSARSRRPPRRDGSPLFHEGFYRARYPDVAGSSVPGWLHYQVLGRNEGRSPHPLIDAARVAAAIPTVRPSDALDVYLAHPEFWLLSPGPYLDTERFVLEGPWDGRTNPALQILRDYPVDPWVRSRIGVIDLATGEDPLTIALGVLTTRNRGLSATHAMTRWRADRRGASAGGARVVPGMFVGRDGAILARAGRDAVSLDDTAVAAGDEIVTIDVADRLAATVLVFAEDAADDAAVIAAASGADGRIVVAAADADQRARLLDAGLDVLPMGRQVAAEVDRVIVVTGVGSSGGSGR